MAAPRGCATWTTPRSAETPAGWFGKRACTDSIPRSGTPESTLSDIRHDKESKFHAKFSDHPSLRSGVSFRSRSSKTEAELTLHKEPRLEFVNGRRWEVEFQSSPEPIFLREVELGHEVLISSCVGATIVVEGKVKTIQIDNCRRTQVVFEAAVTGCEVVNCERMRVQCRSMVPSVSVDKTDGCVIYLSYEGRSAQIVTSKSSELNVSFPESDAEDADWPEKPIPEQFVTRVQEDGTLSTTVSDLYL